MNKDSPKGAATVEENLLLYVLIILLLVYLAYYKITFNNRLREEKIALEEKYRKMLEEWKKESLASETSRITRLLEEKYKALLQQWITEEENRIRRDALEKSSSTVLGRVGEQLAPLLFTEKLGASPKDARFIGSPIDYVVFKGLYNGKPEEILFVEVKSGKNTSLTKREKMIRELVEKKKVKWVLMTI